jgi:hypothetical protein
MADQQCQKPLILPVGGALAPTDEQREVNRLRALLEAARKRYAAALSVRDYRYDLSAMHEEKLLHFDRHKAALALQTYAAKHYIEVFPYEAKLAETVVREPSPPRLHLVASQ